MLGVVQLCQLGIPFQFIQLFYLSLLNNSDIVGSVCAIETLLLSV